MDVADDSQDELDDDGQGINVTPLIDVSLILVLIFLVASPFFSKSLMAVTLPRAATSLTEDQENLTVSISPSEGYAINEIPIQKEALRHELRRQMRDTGIKYVLIRADERVPHGDVEDVMSISQQLGAHRIAFGTEPR